MTKFQDEVLPLIANYESKRNCQAVGPQHSLLKASRSKMDNVGSWQLQESKYDEMGFWLGVRVDKLTDY